MERHYEESVEVRIARIEERLKSIEKTAVGIQRGLYALILLVGTAIVGAVMKTILK
jgi:hypothetical protein